MPKPFRILRDQVQIVRGQVQHGQHHEKNHPQTLKISPRKPCKVRCVYIVDRNLKSEQKLDAVRREGFIEVDLSGEPLQVVYQKKMIPEFTIYQV